jgi:hypothetical protein
MTVRNGFARSMLETANGKNGAMAMIALFREFADRLEGRPKQATESRQRRVTLLIRQGDPPPPWLPEEVQKEIQAQASGPGTAGPAGTASSAAPEPDLVPMEGPPEGF